ncbi:hypothetical protein [Agromyces sp. S2-1-8]|uniref:hypothetical protein n=1 Tax=Agromyces sp. S2-1-8 TaxID=2897180 RepID=UPI001E3F10B2|nr:hypothetical protein [Agromyces sp. S2-1-8]MCD5346065.1 hypothetical protein [Agromyces sp. S2-1-8]
MSISRPIATALAAAGLAGVLVFGLSACSPEPAPKPSPTPSASAEPIFASDEEALAAAVKAYEAYLRVASEATSAKGATRDALERVAVGTALDDLDASIVEYQDEGFHSNGYRSLGKTDLQSVKVSGAEVTVTIYACEDLRSFDVLDAKGESVVLDDRVEDVPYEVVAAGDSSDELSISQRVLWEGENFCL